MDDIEVLKIKQVDQSSIFIFHSIATDYLGQCVRPAFQNKLLSLITPLCRKIAVQILFTIIIQS